ncbi:hypothetical protein CXG81DRAFT_27429 [Caulochytrium protostelioides]|uniref:Uncharacterized protein n=1 Tax=Caulochytrium protostelioides TaxID=1555241 RepID=A0A4P9X465_9FUNG|nr:hypothetical protein CXG81DRAFT_27429 [Caulochytrium protostelioides]|eukprot:RKO99834.1 hypothetical protein CXG81DRAFT_27429 [Caulochytrium protostelioides]
MTDPPSTGAAAAAASSMPMGAMPTLSRGASETLLATHPHPYPGRSAGGHSSASGHRDRHGHSHGHSHGHGHSQGLGATRPRPRHSTSAGGGGPVRQPLLGSAILQQIRGVPLRFRIPHAIDQLRVEHEVLTVAYRRILSQLDALQTEEHALERHLRRLRQQAGVDDSGGTGGGGSASSSTSATSGPAALAPAAAPAPASAPVPVPPRLSEASLESLWLGPTDVPPPPPPPRPTGPPAPAHAMMLAPSNHLDWFSSQLSSFLEAGTSLDDGAAAPPTAS